MEKTKTHPSFRIDEIIAALILLCIFVDVTLQVVSRLTPGNAIFWTVEVGEMLLAALIWMSVGPATLSNSHVRFDLVLLKMPPKARKYLYIFGNIIFAFFLVLISVILVQLMDFYKNHNTVTTGLQWNKFYVRIPMLLGCLIGTLRLLVQAWKFGTGRLPIPIEQSFSAPAGGEKGGA
ncbi:MAG: TRAP transporter small permease [Spirochaetales bacterium]|jgi:TRAP-type C4-dicarboxylate transport system permease small subunit|nr:TRAP transporter small permease [Spirochaetales bacterium]